MSIEIHAWVQIIPVVDWRPSHTLPVIIRTDSGEIRMATYTGDGGNGEIGYWVELGSRTLISGASVTHWASTHKISRAIQDDIENEDED